MIDHNMVNISCNLKLEECGLILSKMKVNIVNRFWQTEWQGIQFSDIINASSAELADVEFNDNF